jgi:chromosomal replication initiator protein
MAISSITGSEITLPIAKQALRSIIANNPASVVSVESIQRRVSDEFGLKPTQLRERSNTKAIAFPRQIAMYLCKELTGASLPEIGRAFNGKHHTTVLHAVNKIERMRQDDPEINSLIHKLTDTFN